MRVDRPIPEDRTPLKAVEFQILLALEAGDRHGYAILKHIESESGGSLTIRASPFYRKLRRMEDDGLVEEAGERPAQELDDERRRYYRLTDLGRRVAGTEARRLVRLAESSQVARLAQEGSGRG
jgi:DNA-binding PadR family transcriptional regulator